MNNASASLLNSGLFARLLFDIMLPADLAESLRIHGYDVAEARALPLEVQRDDGALLIEAAGLQRLVVTCNYHDPHSNFCSLHEEWQAQSMEHSGILLVPQFQISNRFLRWQVRDRMLTFLNQHTWDELHNQIWWLSQE